jgi:hypothetical protein
MDCQGRTCDILRCDDNHGSIVHIHHGFHLPLKQSQHAV